MTPICLIAGRGQLPNEIVANFQKQNLKYRIIALKGNDVDHDFVADRVVSIEKWGIFRDSFKEWGIKSVVFAGKVDRPNIATLRPDFLLLRYLPKLGLGKLGDDAVMQKILEIFAKDFDLKILSMQDIFGQQQRSVGAMGQHAPNATTLDDIVRGRQALMRMSAADFGQAIAVEGGVVLGVEAIEGTDELIVRTQQYKQQSQGGVLVKMPKLQQDKRIDPPTMGAETLHALHQSGFAGIAISAQDMIIVDEENVVSLADQLGLFIFVMDDG